MGNLRVVGSVLVGSLVCAAGTATAGAHTPMGSVIDNVQLKTTAGEKVPLAGDAQVNVIVFFRPDQMHSVDSLKLLAGCEKDLAGKKVRWVAVMPDRFPPEEGAEAATKSGIKMPVAIDEEDAVYTTFGVAQLPTVAILDKGRTLVQFQPFVKLNFCEKVMARIRRVLGELDDAGLEKALNPAAEVATGETSIAKRDIKLAEMLLKGGNFDKAMEAAKKGAEKDPKSAAAQAMIGRVHAAMGDCSNATSAFDEALKLDPGDAKAQEGKKACAGKK
jgi:peroxiredoxin